MAYSAPHALEPTNLSDFLFDSTNAAVCVVDGAFRIREVNQAFCRGFSVDANLVADVPLGNAMGCCHSVEENRNCGDASFCGGCELWRALEKTRGTNRGEPVRTFIARRFYVNGRCERKRLRVHAQGFDQNGEELIAVMLDDVTELESGRELIAELAELDPLTGIHTRRTLDTAGEIMFQNALRGNLTIAVAVFSLIGIDRLADESGSGAKDRIIAATARALAANTRKSDLLARFGNDAFALVMHGAKPGAIDEVIAKLRAAVETGAYADSYRSGRVALSVGIAERLEATLGAMLRRAEGNLPNNGAD